ncbi:hypothetical protein AB0M29_13850 [Streptomyces sp. NPDC051976]|uniref:hypothetical protein n=1 Tax=Streptomyces sp. NPDC051976 TaxID=3154947 RepID=UPI00343A8F63
MNDWEQDPEVVHQLFFRWQGNATNPRNPRTGIAPVAYSCDEARAWQLYHELAPLLRVEDGPDRPSLVRTVASTGEVVLLHRRAAREPGGRATTNCHALVGDRTLLQIRPTLALVAWKWPSTPDVPYLADGDPRIAPVRHEVLQESWRSTFPKIRTRVQSLAPQLVQLTAAMLRAPGHRLSVRDERLADARNINFATPLLWGLHEIFGNRFSAEFNFATFDTADDRGLGIVFVPEWRASATSDPHLSRISLTDTGTPRDDAHEVAEALVGRYLSAAEPGYSVADLLRKSPWNPAHSGERQLADLAELLGLRRPADVWVTYEPPVEAKAAAEAEEAAAVVVSEDWVELEPETIPEAGPGPVPAPSRQPALAPPSAPLLLDTFTMPARFSVRAFLRERWDRRRRRTVVDLNRYTLPATASLGSPEGPTLRHRLRDLSDAQLLGMLGQPEVRQPGRNLVLQVLADRAPHRTRGEARQLCTRLLEERLYLYHGHSDSDSAVETAAWLFAWAVRPHVRDSLQLPGLNALLDTIGTRPTGADRALALRISVAPYDGTAAADFPPHIWQRLLEALLPDARSAATAARSQPRRQQSPLPAAARNDRRTGRGGGDRTEGSVEGWVVTIAVALICTMVVLLAISFS